MDRLNSILEVTEYGELFEPSLELIKNKFLELAKEFHPDTCLEARATEAFAHITALKDEAIENLNEGIWKKPGRISFEMKRGGWISFEYNSESEFEIGRTYVGEDRVMFLIEGEHLEYYNNAISKIAGLSFADSNMKEEFEKVLPRLVRQGVTKSGYGVMIITKDKDEYPLMDILKRMGNRLDPRHVAWIISRLCSICCYLQYSNIVHNGLAIDNLFINPKMHTVSLLGGWWYAVRANEKMIGTTKDVYEVMSDKCRSTGIAELSTDQEMVHEIAKQLLDNKSLVFKPGECTDIPAAMATWIRNGSGGCAFDEFENWNKTLDDSWGRRRFVDLIVPGIN